MKPYVTIATLFFLRILSFSQEEKFFFYDNNSEKTITIDTNSLKNFHNYRINNEYLWLGNNGLAFFPLAFNPNSETSYKIAQTIRIDTGLLYRQYNVKQAFTDVMYVQGARQEQFLQLLHTRNFSQKGNYSLHYTKINSEGSYIRQKVNNNNIAGTIWWENKKSNYNFVLFANRIQNENQLNGGIENDSLFIQDTSIFSNRKTFRVQLDNAYQKIILNNFKLNQKILLYQNIDSIQNGISHSIKTTTDYRSYKRNYYDTLLNTNFYPFIYNDSSLTKDTTTIKLFNQTIFYTLERQTPKSKSKLEPFIGYTYTDYRTAGVLNYYNTFSLGVKGLYKTDFLSLILQAQHYKQGNRDNDLETSFNIKYTANSTYYINLNYSVLSPSLDELLYYGNHNFWNNENTLTSRQVLNLNIGTTNNPLGIQANINYTDIYKPIYFNYNQIPVQHNGYSQLIQTNISKNINLKKWSVIPKITYQYTGGKDIFRLPDFLTTLKLAYKTEAFKKALSFYTGIEITYYNSIELKGYSPSLNAFYLTPATRTGNYPFVSFFFNAQIKTVRLFFALTHLNSGLSSTNNYFGAYHYPLEDRAFKIGIRWIFKN